MQFIVSLFYCIFVAMKILVVRFSSIGDIVLTTPVVRCLKQQLINVEIHYVTKRSFKSILEHNPYINKIHFLKDDFSELLEELKLEKFDLIIDLHNNLRTKRLKWGLSVPSSSFDKLNFGKFMLTQFKVDRLPKIHIVDRYLATTEKLSIVNDCNGLDYFIAKDEKIDVSTFGPEFEKGYIGLVLGAKFNTKKMPLTKLIELVNALDEPVVLLGGPEDADTALQIIKGSTKSNLKNACGMYALNQSASLVAQAQLIITHDTGLMHIAAAYKKPIISVWGNTTPKFGMYPYVKDELHRMVQVEDLSCRPCSKIGYETCPKQHFNCMNQIEVAQIVACKDELLPITGFNTL